ncbi:hypothetical protein ACPPVO_37140 [Dactylosporangium sp. McL0621]|uniref:hypothetical protein n=1 Tax=Dactylosporangium sp. McL0621 TaxID=3415678 RepID=UPI003CEBAEB9
MTTVLAGLGALAGLAACAGPAAPSAPATGSAPHSAPATASSPGLGPFPYDGRLLGSWGSATYGAAHTEVAIPGARAIKVRGRCSGAGQLAVQLHGKAFDDDERIECDGGWRYVPMVFPAAEEPPDPGPFPMVVDRVDTIKSWEIEAYSLVTFSAPAA